MRRKDKSTKPTWSKVTLVIERRDVVKLTPEEQAEMHEAMRTIGRLMRKAKRS